MHLFYLNAIVRQQSFCTFIRWTTSIYYHMRVWNATCIYHTELNRSPHQNDFNCCRLRNIIKSTSIFYIWWHCVCVCFCCLCICTISIWLRLFSPFCCNTQCNRSGSFSFTQFSENHFWIDFGCNSFERSVNDKKK